MIDKFKQIVSEIYRCIRSVRKLIPNPNVESNFASNVIPFLNSSGIWDEDLTFYYNKSTKKLYVDNKIVEQEAPNVKTGFGNWIIPFINNSGNWAQDSKLRYNATNDTLILDMEVLFGNAETSIDQDGFVYLKEYTPTGGSDVAGNEGALCRDSTGVYCKINGVWNTLSMTALP